MVFHKTSVGLLKMNQFVVVFWGLLDGKMLINYEIKFEAMIIVISFLATHLEEKKCQAPELPVK